MSLRVGDKIFALFVKIFCSRSCSSALCQAPRRKRRNLPGFLTLTCCKYFNLSSLLSSYLLCKFTAAAFPLYGLFGLFRLNSGFLILNIFQIYRYLQIFFCSLVVLLTIRSGISMIERQLKKVVVNLKRTPSWSSDEDNLAAEAGNLNRVFLKKETGDRECKDSYDMDITAAVSTLQKK